MAVGQESLARLMQSAAAGRSMVAALCFLVYDVLISTDQEVEHIWMTPFNWLKLLYLFTRYYSVAVLIALNAHSMTCQEWVVVESVSAILLESAVEVVLILRIHAMYAPTHPRLLRTLLIPSFLAQLIVVATSLAVALPRVMSAPGCITTVFPKEIVIYTITSIVYEAFLFALTVHKYRSARKEGWGSRTLLAVLVRDGIWAFALVLLAMIANTLFFTIAPATLAALGFPWLLAILGVLGPRLILNVRSEYQRTLTHSPSQTANSHTYAFDSGSNYRIPGSGPGSGSMLGSIRFSRSVASSAYVPVSTLESEDSTVASGSGSGRGGVQDGDVQEHERSPV